MMWWQEPAPVLENPAEVERFWRNRLVHQLYAPMLGDSPFDLGVTTTQALTLLDRKVLRAELSAAIDAGDVPVVYRSQKGHPRVHLGDVEEWAERRQRRAA